MIAFLQRKSTVGLALVSFSMYFGLCPTAHFVSSRTQTFIQQENSVILAFERDKNPHEVFETHQSFCAIQI